MTNGLLIYGEIFALLRLFLIYLQLLHSEFPYTVYEENFIFFFICAMFRQVVVAGVRICKN
jgi:hypothetical protein